MTASERIRGVLRDELGREQPHDFHSWRCYDKDRYPGPCDCADTLATIVADTLSHDLAITEAARHYVRAASQFSPDTFIAAEALRVAVEAEGGL